MTYIGKHDHLVVWQKPQRPDWMDAETHQQYPDEMVMRELRVHVQGRHRKVRSRTITVATTLYDHKEYHRKADVAELYRLRWLAELSGDALGDRPPWRGRQAEPY